VKPISLQLRLQPAPANLLRAAIRGKWKSTYVPVPSGNGATLGRGECVWAEGAVSLFVKAHRGDDGLVIDLRVIVDPPPPPAGAAALVA
jgi:hypothetical protein